MFLKIFTVYDSKAVAYMQPFFMKSTGEAIRAFQDTVNDSKTQFNHHPEDFTLFEIGVWDDEYAAITRHKALVSLGTALQFKKEI